jgi:hypothetical protein
MEQRVVAGSGCGSHDRPNNKSHQLVRVPEGLQRHLEPHPDARVRWHLDGNGGDRYVGEPRLAGALSGGAISGTLTVGEAQSLLFPDPQVASVTGVGSNSFSVTLR